MDTHRDAFYSGRGPGVYHPLGKDAALIGEVVASDGAAVVELLTKVGGQRIVQMPYGRELPRIC